MASWKFYKRPALHHACGGRLLNAPCLPLKASPSCLGLLAQVRKGLALYNYPGIILTHLKCCSVQTSHAADWYNQCAIQIAKNILATF